LVDGRGVLVGGGGGKKKRGRGFFGGGGSKRIEWKRNNYNYSPFLLDTILTFRLFYLAWKEDMRSIIMGLNDKNLDRWCECTMEVSYTMNITLHRAIHTTPYEAVFGIKAHRENLKNTTDEDVNDQEHDVHVTSSKNMADIEDCETAERPAKCQTICQQQTQYNKQMIKQTKQSRKAHFKVNEVVAIKIDRVYKTSPIHPNMLLGKIVEIDNDNAKLVTPLGVIKGFIALSRLNRALHLM